MATIIKTWAAAVVLMRTAVYGGSDAVVAADREYDYSGDVDLESAGQEGAHVLVEMKLNFAATRGLGTPAIPDDLIVDVFASLDGSTYDSIPFKHYRIKSDVETEVDTDERLTKSKGVIMRVVGTNNMGKTAMQWSLIFDSFEEAECARIVLQKRISDLRIEQMRAQTEIETALYEDSMAEVG
jgi:hypothetical protein